jgi:hypothetical protein
MGNRSLAVGLLAVAVLAGGCASDKKTVSTGPAGKVWLSADREPFAFSSWDVGRVEWSAAGDKGVPPDVAAVLTGGTIVPIRSLTLTKAKQIPALTVGPAAKVDDHHGTTFDGATPAKGSGFEFDFVGDRLVHFVAAGYDNDGNPSQPVFEALKGDHRDAYGDVKQYALPLTHDECVDLFGGANGLETEINVPPFTP